MVAFLSLITKNLVARTKIKLKQFLDNIRRALHSDILINDWLIYKRS